MKQRRVGRGVNADVAERRLPLAATIRDAQIGVGTMVRDKDGEAYWVISVYPLDTVFEMQATNSKLHSIRRTLAFRGRDGEPRIVYTVQSQPPAGSVHVNVAAFTKFVGCSVIDRQLFREYLLTQAVDGYVTAEAVDSAYKKWVELRATMPRTLPPRAVAPASPVVPRPRARVWLVSFAVDEQKRKFVYLHRAVQLGASWYIPHHVYWVREEGLDLYGPLRPPKYTAASYELLDRSVLQDDEEAAVRLVYCGWGGELPSVRKGWVQVERIGQLQLLPESLQLIENAAAYVAARA